MKLEMYTGPKYLSVYGKNLIKYQNLQGKKKTFQVKDEGHNAGCLSHFS